MDKQWSDFDKNKYNKDGVKLTPIPDLSEERIVTKVRHIETSIDYILINRMTKKQFSDKKKENGEALVKVRKFFVPIDMRIKELEEDDGPEEADNEN